MRTYNRKPRPSGLMVLAMMAATGANLLAHQGPVFAGNDVRPQRDKKYDDDAIAAAKQKRQRKAERKGHK